MPSDLLALRLETLTNPNPPPGITLDEPDPQRTADIAEVYFRAYPPGVACATTEEAVQEILDTFAEEYGVLRYDASAVAMRTDRIVGAIFVVEKSIWDADLPGPFIIDVFVDPLAQGAGVGRALILHAIHQCTRAGDDQISLRIGEGTSPAAHALYKKLGFTNL